MTSLVTPAAASMSPSAVGIVSPLTGSRIVNPEYPSSPFEPFRIDGPRTTRSGCSHAPQVPATQLEGLLRDRGIERVVICGLATDYCVKATALDAVRLGLDTTVLEDGIAAVNLEPGDGDWAIEEMREAAVHLAHWAAAVPTPGFPAA